MEKGGDFRWSMSLAIDDGIPASARQQRWWLVLDPDKVAASGDGDTRSASEMVHCKGGGWEKGGIRVAPNVVSRFRVF